MHSNQQFCALRCMPIACITSPIRENARVLGCMASCSVEHCVKSCDTSDPHVMLCFAATQSTEPFASTITTIVLVKYYLTVRSMLKICNLLIPLPCKFLYGIACSISSHRVCMRVYLGGESTSMQSSIVSCSWCDLSATIKPLGCSYHLPGSKHALLSF